jgi:hypothetical protein
MTIESFMRSMPTAWKGKCRPCFFVRRSFIPACVGSALIIAALLVRMAPSNKNTRLRPKEFAFTTTTANSEAVRYVSLCTDIPMMNARRTGNHLFMLAAALYLAEQTNRTVVMPLSGWPLDDTFLTDDIARYVSSYECPCRVLRPWPRLVQSVSSGLY